MQDVSREVSEGIKVWIALGGIALVLAWVEIPRRRAVVALSALCLLAFANYARFGVKTLGEQIDSYDVLHYYVSAKYFDQVGYFDLYPAILLADAEHPEGPYNRKLRTFRAQDQDGSYRGNRPLAEGLRRAREVRSKFSEKEWAEFKRDVYHLQRDFTMTPTYFGEMMQDRGFNGTPVWLLLASPVAKFVDVSFIKLLCYLDVLWLLLALGAVYWAYGGWVPVLWGSMFLCVTYSLRWPVPGQALLRYDWVSLMVIAMCLLRKGKFLLAGVAAGVPTLLRFFPAIWMFGPASRGLVILLAPSKVGPADSPSYFRGRVSRSHVLFAAAFLATIVALQGAATITYGSKTVADHAANMSHHIHPLQLSSRRMGLAVGMMYDGAKLPKLITREQKQEVLELGPARWALCAVLLLALGWGARRLRDDEAYAAGFIPFFFLSTFSYYYAVARLTLIVWHASDLSNIRNRVGLAALLGLELFCNFAETRFPGHRLYLIGHLSWGMTAYGLLMIGWLLFEQYSSRSSNELAELREPAFEEGQNLT